jgi:outer membrane murein-binding lipoprotein Lpp
MTSKLKFTLLCATPLAACLMTGCASSPKQDPIVFTQQALAATDATKMQMHGTPAESEAIARFETFNGDFSAANITNNTSKIYAQDLYFRDPFKEVHGEAPFEAYLLRGPGSVAQFSIDWKDVAESKGDYYFRWVMTLKLKRDSKSQPPTLTCGISEVRFGAEGKVIFQQDYYDAGAFLYEKLPILGGEIRYIKKRM